MNIVILTGAGISAESGIPTFRDSDGLWYNYKIEDVATPEGFKNNPDQVLLFYNMRRQEITNALPNDAHKALAKLENYHKVTLITQNIDDLHERGGSSNVLHMHGNIFETLCNNCGDIKPIKHHMMSDHVCDECQFNTLRPNVVWFGEIPYYMKTIQTSIENADLFVSIGTSGNVYPAAGFVDYARKYKVDTMEINLHQSENFRYFGKFIQGKATVTVPMWVDEICNI